MYIINFLIIFFLVFSNKSFAISTEDKVLGCNNAKNTIIEYSSLTCPHCATFHDTVFKKLNDNYITKCKLKYIFRHFPTSIQSLDGAMLTYCSANYYSVIDLLFHTQNNWAFSNNHKDKLYKILFANGLKKKQFDSCLENKDLKDKILSNGYYAAKKVKIEYTPTLIINGKKMKSLLSYEEIEKLLIK